VCRGRDLLEGCALAAAMKLLGGRYKPMILWYVHHGIDRFGALRRVIVIASQKMLYQQLRELERDGLLVRHQEGRAVRYALTVSSSALVAVLESLERWSVVHGAQDLALSALGASRRRRRAA
jgi:DNA-binding HxlR family transcriptional regulator